MLELDENDPGRGGPVPTQAVVAQRAGVHVDTVVTTSRIYAEQSGDVEATITRKKRVSPPVEPKVTGEVGARFTDNPRSTNLHPQPARPVSKHNSSSGGTVHLSLEVLRSRMATSFVTHILRGQSTFSRHDDQRRGYSRSR